MSFVLFFVVVVVVVVCLLATTKFSQKQINKLSPRSYENFLSDHLKLIKFQENMIKTDQVRKYNTYIKEYVSLGIKDVVSLCTIAISQFLLDSLVTEKQTDGQ